MGEEQSDSEQIVVLDCGSFVCKVGFADADEPHALVPSIVGYVREGTVIDSEGMEQDVFVGDEARSKRDVLNIHEPIQHGIVTNWDDMEKIWHHSLYNELRVDPEECSVLLTEPSVNPRVKRERVTQIMFETFHVSNLRIVDQAMLSLYSEGRVTGIVVDYSDSAILAVPLYDGYQLPHAIRCVDLAGCDLTAEVLFEPSLAGKEAKGIHDTTHQSIMLCDRDIRRELWRNVCLYDGSNKFEGIVELMKEKLEDLGIHQDLGIHPSTVHVMPLDEHSAWIGGSIFSALSTIEWISRAEYHEHGPTISHTKCV